VRLHLPGKHNIYNALAAFAAAGQLGVPLKKSAHGLEKLKSVPGRLESIDCGQNFTVVVDYAHTEDALKNVLEALKPLAKGRILTLFGCGGDRDRSKRPLMGSLAVRMSDHVILTSDNPRSEDPKEIILDIEVGIHRAEKNNYEIVVDREEAIGRILQMAKKDDIVLLAGKGHETYQIFKDKTIHFDDREVARRFLSK
jgi:UDP-N-acetylmuramoyl-L-alanyl-D-glutamate--2,6-diaminopimelate ligase